MVWKHSVQAKRSLRKDSKGWFYCICNGPQNGIRKCYHSLWFSHRNITSHALIAEQTLLAILQHKYLWIGTLRFLHQRTTESVCRVASKTWFGWAVGGHGLAQIKLNQRIDKNRPVTIYWTNYQETTSENKLTKQLKDFSFGRAWHLDQRNLQVTWRRKKQLLVKCCRSNRMNNHCKTAVTHTEIRHPRLPEPSWNTKIVLYIYIPAKCLRHYGTLDFPCPLLCSQHHHNEKTTSAPHQVGRYLLPKDPMSLL